MFNFNNYKKGIIRIELQSQKLEKIINFILKRDVSIYNVVRCSVNVIIFSVDYSNYEKLKEISKETNCRIKIIERQGFPFDFIKLRRRIAVIIGIFLFIALIILLSGYIWEIDIITEKNVSPFEIREQLLNMGIKAGINKKSLNVYNLEEEIIKGNDNIMWAKVRIEGSKLKINVAERQSPPVVTKKDNTNNVIAKKDGQIVSAYAKEGTLTVKNGDVVRKGQILISGIQGKEGSTYPVEASGVVIAKTYYEEGMDVPLTKIERIRTGKEIDNYYVVIRGKKIYLKNSLNNFTNYDKIEEDKFFIKKEIYYEIKEKPIKLDVNSVVKNSIKVINSNLETKFDKYVTVKDKIVQNNVEDDICKIRVLWICEEDIAEKAKN